MMLLAAFNILLNYNAYVLRSFDCVLGLRSANHVSFYLLFNLRNLLYLIFCELDYTLSQQIFYICHLILPELCY